MTHASRVAAIAYLTLSALFGAPAALAAVDFDIVYVRQPRYGDFVNTTWPDAGHPGRIEPGSDLMLLRPDGTEEVLIDAGDGAVTDPVVSFDGEWVYYAYFHDVRPEALNELRNGLSYAGADIFRLHVPTRVVEQLTFGEFTPNTAAGDWDESDPVGAPEPMNSLGYGVLNTGPCPLPDGRIAFTSSRNGFDLLGGIRYPVMQIFVMDHDGANVTCVSPMSLAGALHPVVLRDGRIIFSSHETQGLRDRRQWSLLAMWPDGRRWAPVVSSFRRIHVYHFPTQLSDGDIAFVDYYNLNNKGFGALRRVPEPDFDHHGPFHSPEEALSPDIATVNLQGEPSTFRMPFTPVGLSSITPFTHGVDQAAPLVDPQGTPSGPRVGKMSLPSAAPNGAMLACWSPGPVNDEFRPVIFPAIDSGIYLINDGQVVMDPTELTLIKDDPAYNEAWPRPLLPYSAIHGVEKPAVLPWLPNDGTEHADLPEGTPYGVIGASSIIKRETAPGFVLANAESYEGLDPFASLENQSSNWLFQGADAGRYDDDDIWAVRILLLEPNAHRSYGPHAGRQFHNHANERMRILGEIPVRKPDGSGGDLLDDEGDIDTSFLARIPADAPFTFQTLDRRGMVLNASQTWHQLRPGELRNDCGGCHSHSQTPKPISVTAAGELSYETPDLTHQTPLIRPEPSGEPTLEWRTERAVDVEFYDDIRPILQRSCVPCHAASNPLAPADLVFDDYTLYDGLPGDYVRLAGNEDADWGHPPILGNSWTGFNASRYVRKFQSRRSLLMWKLHGERLDGWTNGDHPSPLDPTDPSTLPPGADPELADIDYTGDMMPPPGMGVPPLTEAEKMTFARWIDLGCPIDSGREQGAGHLGWYLDEIRPVAAVSTPRPGDNPTPLNRIRVGLADAYSGLDMTTFQVTASIVIDGRAPGVDLSDLFLPVADGVWEASIDPVSSADDAVLLVTISDLQGNVTRTEVTFSIAPSDCFADFDGDGRVTIADLNRLLENWNVTGAPFGPGDATGDGFVDFMDLNVLLTAWGDDCP
ncbi:MAG: hypothetical protein RIB32_02775 [Phycisphaerales bacterium]